MTDALCGTSNALQNFQKHTSVDRTLQQDRLVARQPPAQVFRSRSPNAGILDTEFRAFETNFANNSTSEFEQVGPYLATNHGHQHPIFSPAGTGDWAADFQRLRLSGPSYGDPQHQSMLDAPINKIIPVGWQDEFVRQQQQQNSLQHSSHESSFQPSFRQNYQTSRGMVQPLSAPQDTLQAQDQLQAETFDESAFETAFEQARAQIEIQQSIAVEQQDVTESELLETDTKSRREQTENIENIRIGSDLILHNDQTDTQEQRDDGNELAKTAGHLLDSVRHDQSQKFRDSSFLALMRRIRDREVQVEGDEFREVSTLS